MTRGLWERGWVRWWSARLLTAGFLYVASYTALHWKLSAALDEEIAWVRSRNAPVLFQELMSPPYREQIPAGEDALPFFQAAAALCEGIPEEAWRRISDLVYESGKLRDLNVFCGGGPTDRRPRLGKPLSDEETAQLRELVRANGMLFDLLTQAAARPRCGDSAEYIKGTGALLPAIQRARALYQFLKFACGLAAHEGDAGRAVDRWLLDFSVHRHAGSYQKTLVGCLAGVAVEGGALALLEELMRSLDLSEGDLSRLQDALSGQPVLLDRWRQAMRGERAFGGTIWQSWLSGVRAADNPGGWRAHGLLRLWLQADYLWNLRHYRAQEEALEEGGDFAANLRDLERVLRDEERRIPRYALLTRMLFPAAGKISREVARCHGHRLTARWAVSLYRHKLRTGTYPETLEGLLPELKKDLPDPVDPFTGKPLLYRREGEGFLLYSVGPDRKDDGGRRWVTGGLKDDIAFSLTR